MDSDGSQSGQAVVRAATRRIRSILTGGMNAKSGLARRPINPINEDRDANVRTIYLVWARESGNENH